MRGLGGGGAAGRALGQFGTRVAQIPADKLLDHAGPLVLTGSFGQFIPLIAEPDDPVRRVGVLSPADHAADRSACICAIARTRLDVHMHTVLALHMHDK